MKRQKEIKLSEKEKNGYRYLLDNYIFLRSGNYKTFGFQDFSNPNDLSLEQIQTKITEKLISGEFFYPEESGIEKFEFHKYCDDYSWYEFEFIEFVSGAKLKKSIEEFIAGISTKPDFQK